MIPILAPIMGMLANKGLDLLSGAIEGGADKAVEFVKEKTGIDLNTKTELSQEDIGKLNEFQLKHKEKLAELALKDKKEDNRHDEKVVELAHSNTANAREANVRVQESVNASELAKDAAYYIDFAVIGGTLLMGLLLFVVKLPDENVQIANILFGAFLGYVGTIVNYNRGSSASSKDKDDHLKTLTKKG